MKHAPAIIIFSAVYKRTTGEYGRWGIRYVHMEVGHAAQNLALQAVALGMNTTMVGAFEDGLGFVDFADGEPSAEANTTPQSKSRKRATKK